MGSIGGGQGAPPGPSIICCMCGDRGLPGELFRCKVCLFRSQHKYCSNLYPKAETYKACNWCLEDDRSKALAGEAEKTSYSSSSQLPNVSGSFGWKPQRGALPLQVTNPVKKQRAPEQIEKREELSQGTPSSGRVRQTFRGKARRYKLLGEVSS